MVKLVRSNQSETQVGSCFITTLLASVEYHSKNRIARLIEDPNLHGDEDYVKLVVSNDMEKEDGVSATISIIRSITDADGLGRSVYDTYPVIFLDDGKIGVEEAFYLKDTALVTLVPFMSNWLEEIVKVAKGVVADLLVKNSTTPEDLIKDTLGVVRPSLDSENTSLSQHISASAEASTSESLSLSAYLSNSLSESISQSESLRQSQLSYLSECSESLAQSVSAYATSVEESVQNSLSVIESAVLSSVQQSLSEFKVGVSATIEHSLTTYRSMVEDSYTSVSESLENDLKVIQSVEGSWSGGVVETSSKEEVSSDVLLDSDSEEEVAVDLDGLIATLREEETSSPKKELGLSLDFAKDFSGSGSENEEDTAQLETNAFENIEKSLDKLWESKDKPAKGLKKFVSPLLGKRKKKQKNKSKKEESTVVEDSASKSIEEGSPKKKPNKGYQAPATRVGGINIGNGTYQVTFDE